MLAAMVASVVLVVATVLILYETLRFTSDHLAELPVPPRARIIVVVLAAFAGHTAAVWTYALGYWLLSLRWQVGGFSGLPVEGFQDCLYFSVVTYTSLGFGDHVPISHARLIAGVEALNGLLLIGWSASFTYLAMERCWPMHVGDGSSFPAARAGNGAGPDDDRNQARGPRRRIRWKHAAPRTSSAMPERATAAPPPVGETEP